MKIKITKPKLIFALIFVCILTAAWFYGGNYAKNDSSASTTPSNVVTQQKNQASATKATQTAASSKKSTNSQAKDKASHKTAGKTTNKTQAQSSQTVNAKKSTTKVSGVATNATKAQKDKYQTDPIPTGKPKPIEPQNAAINTDKKYTCTLSVSCKTILNNMENLKQEKLSVLPQDGVIFPATKVTFYKGESVFNVLQREMKKNSIQMEFEATPIYNSNYIEGIHNIYEFDCGELSGWMYKVNGWFPNYGCSRYELKDGDVVAWVYTCDLGRDVGGGYSAKGSSQ